MTTGEWVGMVGGVVGFLFATVLSPMLGWLARTGQERILALERKTEAHAVELAKAGTLAPDVAELDRALEKLNDSVVKLEQRMAVLADRMGLFLQSVQTHDTPASRLPLSRGEPR